MHESQEKPRRRIAWGLIVLQVVLTVYMVGAVAVSVLLRFREVMPWQP
jgi:hypothetical protein